MPALRRFTGAALAAALLVTAAAPASAQRWGHYRHRGHDTFGNVLLGGLIGGVLVAAVGSSAARNRKTVEAVGDAPPPLPAPPLAPPGAYPSSSARDSAEDEAVDICTRTAEDGGRAHVERITHVAPEGRAYRVDGELDDGGRAGGGFTCAASEGRLLEFRTRTGGTGPTY